MILQNNESIINYFNLLINSTRVILRHLIDKDFIFMLWKSQNMPLKYILILPSPEYSPSLHSFWAEKSAKIETAAPIMKVKSFGDESFVFENPPKIRRKCFHSGNLEIIA